ncbi:hypothetical protein HKX48_008632 [Thoreauomyces humboldtii]|nr:hypothetical protein HKX48_008632 [Thoreauomyces humboldtii]
MLMITALLPVQYMPYYSFKFALLRTTLHCNFALASLCCVYNLVRPGSDIGIIYCILVPFMAVFANLLAKTRKRMIENVKPEDADVISLELKIRFLLLDHELLFRVPPKANQTLHTASPGDINYDPTGGEGPGSTREKNAARDPIDVVNSMYVAGVRQNPTSCLLRLFVGQFQLLQMGNKAQCLATHEKAATLEPKMDESFLIFRRKRMLHDRFAGGDVIDFIAFEQSLQLATK